jgi:phosphatidylserine decarboxylase
VNIHKEGRKFLTILFIILAIIIAIGYFFFREVSLLLPFIVIACLLLFLFFLQFFRNPTVEPVLHDRGIVAPANGTVVVIDEVVENEYFKDKRKRVSIFMSPFDVHVCRNLVSGTLKYFRYHKGKFLAAFKEKSSEENERTTLVYETTDGKEILTRQIAGAVARRLVWYCKEGEKMEQGQPFGFIKFGSRMDIYMPLDTKVMVDMGTKTKGGKTIIADFA